MTDNNTSERKPLILIAEDVESNYKLLEIILKKEYDLLWAKNGKEAVAYALSHNPDAVLMDIKMPVMDGIEALKEIRLHTDSLPVIMQTAMLSTPTGASPRRRDATDSSPSPSCRAN